MTSDALLNQRVQNPLFGSGNLVNSLLQQKMEELQQSQGQQQTPFFESDAFNQALIGLGTTLLSANSQGVPFGQALQAGVAGFMHPIERAKQAKKETNERLLADLQDLIALQMGQEKLGIARDEFGLRKREFDRTTTQDAEKKRNFEAALAQLTPEQQVLVRAQPDLLDDFVLSGNRETAEDVNGRLRFVDTGELVFSSVEEEASEKEALELEKSRLEIAKLKTENITSKQKVEKANTANKKGLEATLFQIDNTIIPTIQKAKEALKKPVTQGVQAQISKGVGGTPAFSLDAMIGTLQGNVVIDTLMEMKRSSPTGASGFGQLNTAELEAMRDRIASLRIGLPDKTLEENLTALEENYLLLREQATGGLQELGVETKVKVPSTEGVLKTGRGETVTQEDIEFTAQQNGLTVEEVKKRLGIK